MEKKEEDYTIVYPDGSLARLNRDMIRTNGVSHHEILKIRELHLQKFDLFAKMRAAKDKLVLRELARQVEQLEYDLQKCWQFPRDNSFHRWYQVPQCTCPQLDNEDCFGTPHRY